MKETPSKPVKFFSKSYQKFYVSEVEKKMRLFTHLNSLSIYYSKMPIYDKYRPKVLAYMNQVQKQILL